MGLTMDQVNAGAADAFKLINQSMDTWDRIQATIHPDSTVPQQTTQPAVQDRAVNQSPPSTGMAAVPMWIWGVGIGLLLWRFAR